MKNFLYVAQRDNGTFYPVMTIDNGVPRVVAGYYLAKLQKFVKETEGLVQDGIYIETTTDYVRALNDHMVNAAQNMPYEIKEDKHGVLRVYDTKYDKPQYSFDGFDSYDYFDNDDLCEGVSDADDCMRCEARDTCSAYEFYQEELESEKMNKNEKSSSTATITIVADDPKSQGILQGFLKAFINKD